VADSTSSKGSNEPSAAKQSFTGGSKGPVGLMPPNVRFFVLQEIRANWPTPQVVIMEKGVHSVTPDQQLCPQTSYRLTMWRLWPLNSGPSAANNVSNVLYHTKTVFGQPDMICIFVIRKFIKITRYLIWNQNQNQSSQKDLKQKSHFQKKRFQITIQISWF